MSDPLNANPASVNHSSDPLLDAAPTVAATEALRSPRYDRLITYYEEAGPDFEEWSAAYNMHYGYFRRGLNPLRREPMLNEMNRQVLERLRLPRDREDVIVDLGCGVGATVRCAAAMFPQKRIIGITVVPWQVMKGDAWNQRLGLHPRVRLELADYTDTGFPAGFADGAIAIESACHADGADKACFVREAARILKRGARLVVADAFLKNPQRALGRISRRLHERLCRSFVLPELGQIEAFADAMMRSGFYDVSIEDVSWRVAPSALHAPFTVVWFMSKKLFRRQALSEYSLNTLTGSLASAMLGANLLKLGYYLVSGTRR